MLMNPFYAGFVGYRGMSGDETATGKRKRRSKRDWQWVKGTHEPLISEELFERCQQVRLARGRHWAGRRPARSRVYLLSRLARCAHCGRPLRSTRWSTSEANAYRCTAHERGYECSARHTHVPEATITGDLDDIIAQLKLTERVRAGAIALIESGDETAAIERRRAQLDVELSRLNRMYQLGNIGDDYYDGETARVRSELASLARPANAIDIRAATGMLDSMAGLWTHATTEERSEMLRAMFDAIAIDVDARRVAAFKPKSEYAALMRAAFAIYGSDGRRIFARREGFRPRPNDLFCVANESYRLAESRGVYFVRSNHAAMPAPQEQSGDLSIVHYVLLAAVPGTHISPPVLNRLHRECRSAA
jgi:hypothetical protein